MKKSALPKKVYVVMQKVIGGDTYPFTYLSLNEIPSEEHNNFVGIYELMQVSKFIVQKGLK